MNSRLHRCAHPDCEQMIPLGLFACREHWFALPKAIRSALHSAYARIRTGSVLGIDAHDKASAEALAYWTGQP